MLSVAWMILAGLASAGGQSAADLREELRDPARVFPAFQHLVAAGLYSKAYNNCLSDRTPAVVGLEEFQIAMSALEAARRLVASFRVHAVDPAGTSVRICSPEFGASRTLGLRKFRTIYTLDMTRDDFEFFRDRTLSWFRTQVRRADGWHFAYPPDWTYAPVARHCGCVK
jgi:hypothetical protein